jgi:hypothetical protein
VPDIEEERAQNRKVLEDPEVLKELEGFEESFEY